VIARVLEERGISTIAISLIREHTVKIKPPRAVWVPFPFGHAIGHRNDIAEQRAVLDLAFSTLDAAEGPVLLDFAAKARNERAAPLQASEVEVDAKARTIDLIGEVEDVRARWETRPAEPHSHVGASTVAPAEFVNMVRFLQAYAGGEDAADFSGRPAEISQLQFIRYAVEDLRVMYLETRMREEPAESGDDSARWLLGSTALGVFMRALRERMEASDDPKVKAGAAGMAR
jgi:hypothetical protein